MDPSRTVNLLATCMRVMLDRGVHPIAGMTHVASLKFQVEEKNPLKFCTV
jgi:hypothetical protein